MHEYLLIRPPWYRPIKRARWRRYFGNAATAYVDERYGSTLDYRRRRKKAMKGVVGG